MFVRSFIHTFVRIKYTHSYSHRYFWCAYVFEFNMADTPMILLFTFFCAHIFSPIQTFDLNNECVNKSNESHRIAHVQNSNGTILHRANTRYSCTIQIDAFYLVTSFIILNKTRRFFNLTIHVDYLFVAFKNIWDMVLELQKNTRR